jgi:hypothetical protein
MSAKIVAACISLIGLVGITHAQTTTPQSDGATQAAGLFLQTCLNFAGSPAGLRDFLKKRQVPELNPEGRAIFLRDHVGMGFDASNKATRLAVVSEDNGVCSIFAGQGNLAQVLPLIESINRSLALQMSQSGGKETDSVHARYYNVIIKDRTYKLVISDNPVAGAAIQAALTLSP